jgi:hypothetical protein
VGAVGLDQLGLAGRFGGFGQWDIVRKPATSMPGPRAAAMCWAELSALGAVGATRMERLPGE